MSGRVFTKENFAKLDEWERGRLMYLQMAPQGGYGGFNLPDDCGECGACGQPTLGSGWCGDCYEDWDRLMKKLVA